MQITAFKAILAFYHFGILPFKDQISADIVKKQLKDLSLKVHTTIQPVFVSRKIERDLNVKETKPPIVNQQCVVPREARLINQSGRRPERSESRANSSEKYIYIHIIYLYISMKVSVLLPGNSANTVCLTSEKGKVARQQQVVRQAGVRGNLQLLSLLCNWSKVARTGNYKR